MDKTLIMAAPNGARKTKADHPNLPVTIEESAREAKVCFDEGAGMLHAHVRDDEGRHVLDSGRYRELLALMAETCPDMPCQITTEAVGIYSPQDQAQCLFDTAPDFASLAIAELVGDRSAQALDFAASTIREASAMGVKFQYILYSTDDLDLLNSMTNHPQWPQQNGGQNEGLDALFVLGKYNPGFKSHPDDLNPFMEKDHGFLRSWMVCAFGPMEYDVMVKAASLGGHARVGFENNIYLKSGEVAPSTSALVRQLADQVNPMSGPDARMLFS